MATQSWATKYRPRRFQDLVGHSVAVSKLKGMLQSQTLPAAILLTGGTGVGKTTLSRMFARYVNCKTHKACGKCDSCLAGLDNHPDYVEINAADTRGIDDVRALIQQTRFKPIHSAKIFCIDEAHQLTPQASQCLPESAELLLSDGSCATIMDIVRRVEAGESVSVLSFNHATGSVEAQTIEGSLVSEPVGKDMYRVVLEDGSFIECTGDHLWWSSTREAYVRADSLTEADEVLMI